MHGRAAIEYRTFQCIGHLTTRAASNGREQTVGRLHRLVARVHQQEAAGAVGILGLARLNAHLAEQCRLLVAGDTGDGYAALGMAVHFRGWAHLRQHLPRDAQNFQQLVVPLQAVDVEHQRARGVGVVGDVNLATRKLPDQPGVDGAEQQFATLGAFTGASTLSRIHFSLVPEKYGSVTRPVVSRM